MHEATDNLIRKTPGVRVLLARAWVVFVEAQEFILRLPADDLFRYTYLPDTVVKSLSDVLLWESMRWRPNYMAEFLDGVGGNSQFALAVVNHINCFLASPQDSPALRFLDRILTFVTDVDKSFEMVRSSGPHGIVPGLARVLCALTNSKIDGAIQVIQACLGLLFIAFSTAPSYERIVEALEAGFIRGVVSYVCREEIRGVPLTLVSALFKDILLRLSIHRAVLMELGPALMGSEMVALTQSEAFKGSSIFDDFRTFYHVCRVNLMALNQYHSPQRESMLACDNMQCGNIAAKNKFRQCSNCEEVYYCSERCQALDWDRGGHRISCQRRRWLRLSHPCPLPKRGMSFLRNLLHATYEDAKASILLSQVGYLRELPTAQFLNVFDFTVAPVALGLFILSDEENEKQQSDAGLAQYRDFVARVQESHGRMELFIMRVCSTPESTSEYIFPLRASDSRLHDGVRRIASTAPAGVPIKELRGKVEELIASTKGTLIEIH
ncbi:hypothetical protein B0H14DRAFT_760822 [Mycena olivaceomarginata]|nr:hypothetical protein B0H14DRAFT_760822 [Mycena olivaceomarginata]